MIWIFEDDIRIGVITRLQSIQLAGHYSDSPEFSLTLPLNNLVKVGRIIHLSKSDFFGDIEEVHQN